MRVPRTKLEAHGYRVMIGSTRQLQETGGVEKDWEGVGLRTGEGQVSLSAYRIRKKKEQRWTTGDELVFKQRSQKQS